MVFEYKVKIIDDEEEKIFYGLTFGETYQDAIDELSEFYDHYKIRSISLEDLDTNIVTVMRSATLENLKEEMVHFA